MYKSQYSFCFERMCQQDRASERCNKMRESTLSSTPLLWLVHGMLHGCCGRTDDRAHLPLTPPRASMLPVSDHFMIISDC